MTGIETRRRSGFAVLSTVALALIVATSAWSNPGSSRYIEIGSGGGTAYATSPHGGIFVSSDGGATWVDRSAGLPRKVVYPFTQTEYRAITSIGIDPTNGLRVAVTTGAALLLTDDAGLHWRAIKLKLPVKPYDYFTAVALSNTDPETIYLGTSFNDMFVTRDGGASWESFADSMQFLYRGAGFYDQITSIAVSPVKPADLYVAADSGKGLFRSTDGGKSWAPVAALPLPAGSLIRSIAFVQADSAASRPGAAPGGTATGTAAPGAPEAGSDPSGDATPGTSGSAAASAAGGAQTSAGVSDSGKAHGWLLRVDTADSVFYFSPERNQWWKADQSSLALLPVPTDGAGSAAAVARRAKEVRGRTAIYIRSADAVGERLDSLLSLAKENGFNSVVIDMKDDAGRVAYDTKLAMPKKVGSAWPEINAEALVKKLHDDGLYFIARIVVFQDPRLYKYDGSRYAIWDKATDSPWGSKIAVSEGKDGKTVYEQRQFWVDPYSEAVWKYNIDIAAELQSLGVDEIQFDYFRFPSDPNISAATYRYKRPGMSMSDALESFLRMAREKITIPISLDVFGFNAWYRMGNWIGQNVGMLSNYVDVICPMFYPALFPSGFMHNTPFFDRAKQIYREGTDRAAEIVGSRSIIRPYVQAFLLGSETKMDKPEYTKYLTSQLDGVKSSVASGFTLWNSSNVYYMVTESLKSYTEK